MNALKRNLTLLVLIGAPLVCGVAAVVKFQEDAAQQERNAALIDAIETDSPAEAMRLLASGADANAREQPEDARTFWQKICEMCRPVKREEAARPSALTLALRSALKTAGRDSAEIHLQLLKALHDAGAKEEGRLAPSQDELKEAEQKLAAGADGERSALGPPAYMYQTDDALTDFLNAKGMSARAMTDLAESRFQEEHYAGAAQAYRIAALWQAPDAAQQTRLAQAEGCRQAAAAIQRTLPAGQSLVWVRPYPSALRPTAWLALYLGQSNDASNEAQMGFYQSDGGDGLRQICHASAGRPLLWREGNTSGFHLRILPITERGAPAVFLDHFEPLSDRRACLSVFACANGKFTTLAAMSNDEEIEVEKARRGNGYIIRRQYQTGAPYGPEAGPLRSDYYAFNERKFVLIDAQYPDACRAYISEAEKALRKNPGDYYLRQSLASMYSISGRPQKSEQYYRKAENDCRAAIEKSGDHGYSSDAVLLEQIVARDPERHF